MNIRVGEVRFQAYGFPKFSDPVVTLIRQFTDQSHPVMPKHKLRLVFQDSLKLGEGFVKVLELHQSQGQLIAGLQVLWFASRGRLELREGAP
jgi:hypothetical protein